MKSVLGQLVKLGDKKQVYKNQCNIEFVPSDGMTFLIKGYSLEVDNTFYDLANETLYINFTHIVAEDKFELEEIEEVLTDNGFKRTK